MSFPPLSTPPNNQSNPSATASSHPSLPSPHAQDTAPPEHASISNPNIDGPSPAARPNFTPFFTLLTNTSPSTQKQTTHHPRVHYIFKDDPPDIDPITTASLRILDASTPSPPTSTHHHDPSAPQNPKERYILLDMDASGTKVVSALSMSPDWAVTATELRAAPTWEGEGGQGREEGSERGMMLTIEGMEVDGGGEGEVELGERGVETEGRLQGLVEMYERRLGELKRVVDAGAGAVVGEG